MDKLNDRLHGAVTVSDDRLTSFVAETALDTDGVYDLDYGIRGNIAKGLLGKEMPGNKGVKISKKNEELIIDVYIIARYGVKIPQLAWELQTKIREEVELIAGVTASDVNIHVQGVSLAEEDD